MVNHASGTEWICAVCGWQVDFDYADDFDDDGEPVGSCEECGCNVYDPDSPFLCDQCEWSLSMGASRSNEDIPY
jgi:NAD-dependent SIR2 family protein deacetylase